MSFRDIRDETVIQYQPLNYMQRKLRTDTSQLLTVRTTSKYGVTPLNQCLPTITLTLLVLLK